MKRSDLPAMPDFRLKGVQSDVSVSARQRFKPLALANDAPNEFNLLGEIGDFWGDVQVDDVVRFLRANNGNDVVINVNSVGGDVFDGIAIYNLLRLHQGKVSINVIGLAASAASLLVMAADEINMMRGSFLMIHNCWLWASGNRHDLNKVAAQMQQIDEAMCDIYCARTGKEAAEVALMMDNETYINATSALALGFCDALLDSEVATVQTLPQEQAAAHQIDVLLAKQGIPRSQRRKMIQEIKGTRHAAFDDATQNAGFLDALKSWQADLNS